MSASPAIVLLSASVLASVTWIKVEATCSGDQDCSTDLHCYREACRTAGEIAKLAFNAGKKLFIVHSGKWEGVNPTTLHYIYDYKKGRIVYHSGVYIRCCAGEPCSQHSDCPEACQTRLSSPVCGPFLRSARLPGSMGDKHEDLCHSGQDCTMEEQTCIATLRGFECRTWEEVMVEVFHIGESMSPH